MGLSQLQIAVVIIAGVTLAGVIVSFFRKSAAFAGYEEYKEDVARIVSTLRAETFRDGDDLVITGNHKKMPLQVRFSYAENTPGLNVRMQAPVSFTFSVAPKGALATEGRVSIRTGDDMFDVRFTARTDHPTQAKMLVSSPKMRQQMAKLCCSSKTFLTLTRGSIELSELVIPAPYTARHVLDHVDSMGQLAAAIEGIPGSSDIKIQPYQREKSTPVFRIALAIGAVAALFAVFILKPSSAQPDLSNSAPDLNRADGVSAIDSLKLPYLKGWHAMTPEEFAPEIAGWIRGNGVEPSGRIELQADDKNEAPDVFYLLVDKDGQTRIAMLLNGAMFYDTRFPNIAGAVRVPHDSLAGIAWKIKPSYAAVGDAVMVFERSESGMRPLIMFPNGRNLLVGEPERYYNINLR